MLKTQKFVLLTAIAGFCAFSAGAQWMTQSLNLHQGWNAIFLEVQPEPNDCDTIFGAMPIQSVWTWNRSLSTIQYISDPNSLLPGQPDWLTYLPPADPSRPVANLFTLQGGKPYLIKCSSATTINLRGHPFIRAVDWLSDSFNLAGFYVSTNNKPTFQNFFAPSPAHSGQPMYHLDPSGLWTAIVSPASTTINPGEAYWIRCSGHSSFQGLMQINFQQGRSFDFGRTLTELVLQIENTSSNTTTFTLKKLPSGAPPNPNYPALAGDIPLSYWRMNIASNQVGWVAFNGVLTSPSIAPGAEWTLRLEVRRADMNAFSLPTGYNTALYQCLLDVTDTSGSEAIVPVTASGLQSYGNAALARVSSKSPMLGEGASDSPDPRAGLWVGSADITSVNEAAVSGVALPAASDFEFRLIMHVDASGDTRLLQNVVIAWTNGVSTTNAQGFAQTVTPGRYALITDESLIPKFSGSAIRDGTLTGRRISSAAFGFRDPILIDRTGSFGDTNAIFSCTVFLGYDDDLNPFKDKYHPDHNNLNEHYDGPEKESFDVTRNITFQFSATDPDNLSLSGWGDNQLGGSYTEVITGLHKSPIRAQGTFRLQRAITVPTLNDIPF